MPSFFLGIDIPIKVKNLLSQICCGLAGVQWVETSQFNIILYTLGNIEGSKLLIIQDELKTIQATPFICSLRKVKHSLSKKFKGELWIEASPFEPLKILKNQISHSLAPLGLREEKKGMQPHVLLGSLAHVSIPRLGDYLSTFTYYETPSFEVNSFSLFSLTETHKHTIIQKHHEFLLKND